jgi:hypothetical protein
MNDQRIKPLPRIFMQLLLGLPPPICKRCHPLGGHQISNVKSLKNIKPELLGENTSEDMLNVFIFLTTEGASIWMWEPPPLKTISCPASIPDCKPDEGLAFVWCP